MPTTTVKHVKINKGKGGNLKFLKKIPPWGWLLIAGGVIIFFIWYRAQQAKAAATASDQNAGATGSQVTGTDSYLQGYQDAMLGGGGVGGGYGYGGLSSTGLGYIDSATLAGLAGYVPSGTLPSGSSSAADSTGNAPASAPAQTFNFYATPATSTGGGAPARPASHGGTNTPTIAQYNQQFLAPGAKAPTYRLVRPAKYPHAMWAGPHKPGTNWVGVGGGWWVKK